MTLLTVFVYFCSSQHRIYWAPTKWDSCDKEYHQFPSSKAILVPDVYLESVNHPASAPLQNSTRLYPTPVHNLLWRSQKRQVFFPPLHWAKQLAASGRWAAWDQPNQKEMFFPGPFNHCQSQSLPVLIYYWQHSKAESTTGVRGLWVQAVSGMVKDHGRADVNSFWQLYFVMWLVTLGISCD